MAQRDEALHELCDDLLALSIGRGLKYVEEGGRAQCGHILVLIEDWWGRVNIGVGACFEDGEENIGDVGRKLKQVRDNAGAGVDNARARRAGWATKASAKCAAG